MYLGVPPLVSLNGKLAKQMNGNNTIFDDLYLALPGEGTYNLTFSAIDLVSFSLIFNIISGIYCITFTVA